MDPARRGTRIGWRRLLLAAALVWAVAAGTLLLLGARELGRAKSAALETRQIADAASVRDGTLERDLRRAAARFERGEAYLRNPLLLPLRVLPYAKRQHRSAVALADGAGRMASAGAAAAVDVRRAVATPPPSGPARLEALRTIGRAVDVARRQLAAIDLGPDRGLVGPLWDARVDLEEELLGARTDLDRATHVTTATTTFLSTKRKYVLVAANNAEMRAGSGMFLSAGTLETDNGELHLGEMRPTGDLVIPAPGVPVEGDLAELWGWTLPGQDWRSLAMSPRFEASAPVAARLWEAATGEQVDGVIVVDVLTLRAVLAATGPITVAGEEVSAATIERRLFRDQYEGLTYDEASADAQDERREELGEIAAAAVDALESGRIDLPTLSHELAGAAAGRHLLAWSRHPEEQRGWEAADISGKLARSSLAVAVSNRGGNKLDQYLRVEADLAWSATRAGRREVRVTARIRNEAPDGEPEYVVGPHPALDVPEGTYVGVVSFTVPGMAADLALDGGTVVVRGADGPSQAIASSLQLARGEETELVVTFTVPADLAAIHVEPGARVPPIRYTTDDASWSDERRRRVRL